MFEHATNKQAGGKAKFGDRYREFEVKKLMRFDYLNASAKAKYTHNTKLGY
jgi:hypothetical protein